MKIELLAASAALAMIAAPVSAQLVGGGLGGGLTGQLGGNLGGTLGGVGSSLGRDTMSTVGGTLRGSASGRADRNVDHRSGRAGARAGADGTAGGNLDGVASSALGSGRASASGSGRASKQASVDVQGVGTDGIGGAVGGLVDSAASATGSLPRPGFGGGASAAGSGSGVGQGFGLVDLAAAGSAAANFAGTVAVEPGMIVRDSFGRAIGEVQALRTTANGLVDTVIVEIGNRVAALPADSFSVSGETLISAMSRAEVRRQAQSAERAN